jgi:hypothetical protein
MARRIEIELTSARDDGTWTWRAAGAKEPKGVLESGLLPAGVKVGDVLRVDAEFEIEGISIINVLPPKDKRAEPERLQIIGPSRPAPGVTSSLVTKGGRGKDDRPRRPRDGERDSRPPRGERRDKPERQERGPRPERQPRGERTGRPERGDQPARRRPPAAAAPVAEAKPKPKKLNPGSAHRNAVLEQLSPAQRPVAEQLLRGGIPAVRQAIETQNKAAREGGEPEISAATVLPMAEDLLPALKAAEWLDRAEAAALMIDDVGTRDLRSIVATADAAGRAERGRELATTLRAALDTRVNTERERWLADLTSAVEEGRLVRALRISARAPDPGARFPAELAAKLSEAASMAMAPDASADRWSTLLEAVSASPVRRSVKPLGLPAEPGEELLDAARKAAGRVPALAPMLGISMPPPPGPPRPPPRPPARPRPAEPAAPPAAH